MNSGVTEGSKIKPNSLSILVNLTKWLFSFDLKTKFSRKNGTAINFLTKISEQDFRLKKK
jgi:hypothetical protein